MTAINIFYRNMPNNYLFSPSLSPELMSQSAPIKRRQWLTRVIPHCQAYHSVTTQPYTKSDLILFWGENIHPIQFNKLYCLDNQYNQYTKIYTKIKPYQLLNIQFSKLEINPQIFDNYWWEKKWISYWKINLTSNFASIDACCISRPSVQMCENCKIIPSSGLTNCL